jgi:glycosyltransferase involved in cell wall biosynthesis
VKICFLDESLFARSGEAVNGVRVQSLALARELSGRGHQTFFVSGTHADHDADVPTECEGMPVYGFRAHDRLPFLAAKSASRAVRRQSPDVVYVRGRPYLAGVAGWERRRRGTGFVWASTSDEGCERWKQLRGLWTGRRSPARKLLRTPFDLIADLIADYGVARADVHVCQTRRQCERLLAVHGKVGVIIRSMQVTPEVLPPRDTPPLVLWVGRIAVERNPAPFVRLAASLADVDCHLAMVGPSDDAYRESLLSAGGDLSRLSFAGQVSFAESWSWIGRATVLVNTSVVEGVSNALVQAWHCGTPTVALHFDPDGIIEDNGVGYLSGDLPSLARDVRALVTDPMLREKMSQRARELALWEFSGEAVGAAYEAVMVRAADHV